MKKKLLFMLALLVFFTGCTNVSKSSYDEIVDSIINSKYNIENVFRTGYKYYAPNSMMSVDSRDYNEIVATNNYNYYLYVDVVSYYNRVISEYSVNSNAYYSKSINFEDKYGYIEINKQSNGKYLVEIMYNYAKIEVMVEECDLKNTVANAMIILSSISYNNNILQSIIGDNALQFNEETYDIFKTKKQTTNYLDVEANDIYEEVETTDPDLVE